MKRILSVFLSVILVTCFFVTPAFSGEELADEDYSKYIWFLNNDEPVETSGNGVVLWDMIEEEFRQELLPDDYLPADPDAVGYVIVLQEGPSSLLGFYDNGASGLIRSVDIIAFDASSGVELIRDNVQGGDPPSTASIPFGVMQVYGDWPETADIKAAVEELCSGLYEAEAGSSVWRYVIRTEEDIADIISEYDNTEEPILAWLDITPGIEIQGYDGYIGGSLKIPSEIEGIPVTAIGKGAFQFQYGFDEIIVPDTVTRLGESAFDGLSGTRIQLPDHITVLPYSSLNSYWVEDVQLPADLKAIDSFALSNNLPCTEIDLPDGVEYIAEYAFSDCSSLQEVKIPRDLKYMSIISFNNCENVTLKVYKDSWAYDFLENGWDEAFTEYCEEYEARTGSTPEELNQVPVKPNYEVLDE